MRSGVMNALINPIHLLTLMVAGVSGLIAAWWLFPLGILFWGIMVLNAINDPTERLRQKMDDRQPLASRFEVPFRQIQRVQVQMYNSISPAAPATRRALQPILDSNEVLIDAVYRLCQRMTPVENYRVVSESKSSLDIQLKQLGEQAAAATDPVTRKTYEETRESLAARIEQQNRTAAQLERVDAYLAGLTNEMNSLLGQVIPLQTMPAGQAKQSAQAIVELIHKEISELEAFSTP